MAYEPLEISQLPITGSLPSLPAVALDVLRICQDPESDIADLADGLSRDPILASRVLQMANSAYYNRGTEVTSLNRAAVMIGLRALKVLALGFTLANELPSKGTSGGFDLQLFWHRSLVNAVAGRSIAAAIRSGKTEEAFLCGLLSQMGKLALSRMAPERYAVVVEEGGDWPSEEVEREFLGARAARSASASWPSGTCRASIVHGATYATRARGDPGRRAARVARPRRRDRPCDLCRRRALLRRAGREPAQAQRRGRARVRAAQGDGGRDPRRPAGRGASRAPRPSRSSCRPATPTSRSSTRRTRS